MKIEKKHIAIIAIVVAVVVFLIWKFRKDKVAASDEGTGASASNGGYDKTSFESVLAASGMTSSDADYARAFKKSVEASNMQKESVEQKAAEKGNTYAQQLALDALWSKYYDNETADFKSGTTDSTKSYVWKVQKNIKNM